MKQNKIKILHFIPGFNTGGVVSLFLMWYRNINHQKFDMELLFWYKDEVPLKEYKNMGGCFYTLPPLSPTKFQIYIKAVKTFFEQHHDYDIIHSTYEDPIFFYYANKYGIKNIILHSHSTAYGKDEKYILVKKIFSKISKVYTNHYFACSEFASQWMFGSKKAIIIPNSIETEKFKFRNEDRIYYRKQFNLDDKLVIGHVGRFSYAKNHTFLLSIFSEIYKKNHKTVLILVGDGVDRENIITLSKKLNVNDNILFLRSQTDIEKILSAMDIFLLPSHYEGFGIVVIEAQASGLPCVISDVLPKDVCITDLIQKVSLSKNASQWADIVLSTNKNSSRVKYSHILEKSIFNINNSITLLENIYTEIASD